MCTFFHYFQAPWFVKHPVVVLDLAEQTTGPCMVQIEDQLLKADNPVEGVLLAFCLHWVANLCYHPAARGFYTMLEHLLGLKATKLTGMALSTLSACNERLQKK